MPNLNMTQLKFAQVIILILAFYTSLSAKATTNARDVDIETIVNDEEGTLLKHSQIQDANWQRIPREVSPQSIFEFQVNGQKDIYNDGYNNVKHQFQSRNLILAHNNDENQEQMANRYTPSDDHVGHQIDGMDNFLPNQELDTDNLDQNYLHHNNDNSYVYDHTQSQQSKDIDGFQDGLSSSSSPMSSSLSDIPFDVDGQFPNNNNNQYHNQDQINNIAEPSLPDERIYISRELVRDVCQLDRGSQRSEPLNSTYLNYCKRYKLENLLSNEILMSIMHQDAEICEKILNEFIQLDELINQFDTMFKKLLTRYNCHNGYSVKWSCEDCKKSYKDWLCATNLPFYMNGERIKPCISFCERVEQRCPYLHPITKEQYGGQPVFICRDPNIPFIPEITPDIPFSDPGKCYELCHLSDNLTELVIDSLSKYEHEKCPDKSSIAEGVRIDPYYLDSDSSGSRRLGHEDGKQQHKATTKAATSAIPKQSTTNGPADGDFSENFDQFNEQSGVVLPDQTANETTPKILVDDGDNFYSFRSKKPIHAHNKKLDELREVLTNYKNQPKIQKFGHHIEHASLEHVASTKQFIGANSF